MPAHLRERQRADDGRGCAPLSGSTLDSEVDREQVRTNSERGARNERGRGGERPRAEALAARTVLALQRSSGNRAVARLLPGRALSRPGRAMLQREAITVPGGLAFMSLPPVINTHMKSLSELQKLLDDLDDASQKWWVLVESDDREQFQQMISAFAQQIQAAIHRNDVLQPPLAPAPSPLQAPPSAVQAPASSPFRNPASSAFSSPAFPPPPPFTPAFGPGPTSTALKPAATPKFDVEMGTEGEEKEAPPAKSAASALQIPHLGTIKKLRGNFGTGMHEKFHFAPTTEKSHHGVWGTNNVTTIKGWVGMCVDSIWNGDQFVVGSKAGSGSWRYLVNMGKQVGYLSGSAAHGSPPATHIELYVNTKGVTVSAFPSDPSIF